MSSPVSPRGGAAARWSPGVLGERDFRLFLVGRATSNVGSSMAPVAITFAVLGEGHSAGDVGIVLMAQTIPLVLFVLLGGVLADRLTPRDVMVGADLLRLLAHGLLAVLLLLGHPPLWQFIVLEVFVGVGDAMFGPAATALVPRVASAPRLQEANALLGITSSTGKVIGPAIAGVVVATAGSGWAVAADAATYGVSAACLVVLRLMPIDRTIGESLRTQLAQGWHEFVSRTWLWVVVAQATIFLMLGYAPYIVAGAVVSELSYDGASSWGAILAIEGVGAVVAGVLMIRVRIERPLLVAMLLTFLYAGPMAMLALEAPLGLVLVAAFAAGFATAGWATLWATTVQREIPPDVLSRVSSYDWLGSVALLPVGFALVGPLTDALGLSGVLWLAAGTVVMSTAATLLVPEVRSLRASGPPKVATAQG